MDYLCSKIQLRIQDLKPSVILYPILIQRIANDTAETHCLRASIWHVVAT